MGYTHKDDTEGFFNTSDHPSAINFRKNRALGIKIKARKEAHQAYLDKDAKDLVEFMKTQM